MHVVFAKNFVPCFLVIETPYLVCEFLTPIPIGIFFSSMIVCGRKTSFSSSRIFLLYMKYTFPRTPTMLIIWNRGIFLPLSALFSLVESTFIFFRRWVTVVPKSPAISLLQSRLSPYSHLIFSLHINFFLTIFSTMHVQKCGMHFIIS